MHLMKKNRDLARQNSMLLEKCKAMQSKITVLECSDGVVYADRVCSLRQGAAAYTPTSRSSV